MISYLSILLGLALAGAVTTAAIYRADAADYKSQLVTLKADYATKAQQAKDDAAAQIAKDKAENQRRADASIEQALSGKQKAESQLQSYLQKGNAASGSKDLSRACFSVPIAPELIPK